MKQRSVLWTLVFSVITFGIYLIVWFVLTKGELNNKGAKIPTAWLLIIPFVNIWWMWKYYEGAQQVTNEKVNAILNFLLGFFLSPLIPQALCQSEYNKMTAASAASPEMTAETPTPVATEDPSPPPEPTESTPPPENQQSPSQPMPPEPTPPAEEPPSTDEPKPPLV